ncbi:hypothetical protein LTR08_006187 [Meristemomyces frigidus]|nr:hypothetical protein LTR08_006187 [Meristemomyces frigidus]
MGATLSTTTAISPLTLTSTLIGFVSFAFTLATLLKVLWANFCTLGEAEHEVHAYLTNLRTELLEERASLRAMRKAASRAGKSAGRGGGEGGGSEGGELDEVTVRTMSDAVKHLIRRFREVERPFLMPGEKGIAAREPAGGRGQRRPRRGGGGSRSPYYAHSAYAEPPEKAARRRSRSRGIGRGGERETRLPRYANEKMSSPTTDNDNDDDNDDEDGDGSASADNATAFWAQRTRYADFSLAKRLIWLRKKGEAQALLETLSRVQIRRIARQVAGLCGVVRAYGQRGREVEEGVRRLEERVGRVVGVRRVGEG